MIGFNDKCYRLLRKVPLRKVVTYREIARKLNCKGYRAVGNAMHRNKDRKIKCYKVVCSNGNAGGFNRGKKEKIKLLQKEGIEIINGKIDLKRYGWRFDSKILNYLLLISILLLKNKYH